MSREQQGARLVLARVLGERLTAADRDGRIAVRDGWHVGDRLTATIAGRPAGTVTVKRPPVSASVSDSTALTEWVATTHPTEIEEVTVRRVKPAYLSALLAAAKKTGVAVSSAGEVIPGITVTVGDPSVAVTLEDGAAELVAEAWRSGELAELIGGLLPALEPGGEA